MPKSTPPARYMSFLLRIWQEESDSNQEKGVWRFSLQETDCRQRRGFSSLDELIAYLKQKMIVK